MLLICIASICHGTSLRERGGSAMLPEGAGGGGTEAGTDQKFIANVRKNLKSVDMWQQFSASIKLLFTAQSIAFSIVTIPMGGEAISEIISFVTGALKTAIKKAIDAQTDKAIDSLSDGHDDDSSDKDVVEQFILGGTEAIEEQFVVTRYSKGIQGRGAAASLLADEEMAGVVTTRAETSQSQADSLSKVARELYDAFIAQGTRIVLGNEGKKIQISVNENKILVSYLTSEPSDTGDIGEVDRTYDAHTVEVNNAEELKDIMKVMPEGTQNNAAPGPPQGYDELSPTKLQMVGTPSAKAAHQSCPDNVASCFRPMLLKENGCVLNGKTCRPKTPQCDNVPYTKQIVCVGFNGCSVDFSSSEEWMPTVTALQNAFEAKATDKTLDDFCAENLEMIEKVRSLRDEEMAGGTSASGSS